MCSCSGYFWTFIIGFIQDKGYDDRMVQGKDMKD